MGSFKIVQRLTDANMTRAPRVLKTRLKMATLQLKAENWGFSLRKSYCAYDLE